MVLQAINPNMATCGAAAQKLKKPVQTQLGIFLGLVEAQYQISSKSVEKQKSYGVVLPVQFAPEDRYENDNVRKSPLLNITHLNPFLNAIVIPPAIF